jgi:hypothetical protein
VKKNLGELKHLGVRSIWESEARDFTPWLAEHIAALDVVLGTELEVTSTEVPVGDFSVDIHAKDLSTGRDVVIENQFGQTDHDHLGKLLTYASGVDAAILVWIAESIRDEHRQALEWLNERTDTDTMIFAIVLEVLQIDDSAPAYNFKPIVFPNKWQKITHSSGSSSPSPRAQAYQQFFQKLIDELREVHKFTGQRVALLQSWTIFSSGFSGVGYGASFALGGRGRVEINFGRSDMEANKAVFDWLADRREAIESQFGSKLEWERLDDKQSSRIAFYKPGSIDDPEEKLFNTKKWMIDNLLLFKKVFGPFLKQYFKPEG